MLADIIFNNYLVEFYRKIWYNQRILVWYIHLKAKTINKPQIEDSFMNTNFNKKSYTEEEKNEYIRKMREIREQCFAIIFEMSFSNDSYEDILDNAVESRMIVADNYMIEILKYYSENKEAVDEIIKANIKGWTINRLSKPTLSVLRLAISELNSTKTGKSIIINEAVEITKKYATSKEAAFVNGVLGSIVRNKNK